MAENTTEITEIIFLKLKPIKKDIETIKKM